MVTFLLQPSNKIIKNKIANILFIASFFPSLYTNLQLSTSIEINEPNDNKNHRAMPSKNRRATLLAEFE